MRCGRRACPGPGGEEETVWKSAQTWTGLAAKPEALGSPPGGRAREQVAVYSLPLPRGRAGTGIPALPASTLSWTSSHLSLLITSPSPLTTSDWGARHNSFPGPPLGRPGVRAPQCFKRILESSKSLSPTPHPGQEFSSFFPS